MERRILTAEFPAAFLPVLAQFSGTGYIYIRPLETGVELAALSHCNGVRLVAPEGRCSMPIKITLPGKTAELVDRCKPLPPVETCTFDGGFFDFVPCPDWMQPKVVKIDDLGGGGPSCHCVVLPAASPPDATDAALHVCQLPVQPCPEEEAERVAEGIRGGNPKLAQLDGRSLGMAARALARVQAFAELGRDGVLHENRGGYDVWRIAGDLECVALTARVDR